MCYRSNRDGIVALTCLKVRNHAGLCDVAYVYVEPLSY